MKLSWNWVFRFFFYFDMVPEDKKKRNLCRKSVASVVNRKNPCWLSSCRMCECFILLCFPFDVCPQIYLRILRTRPIQWVLYFVAFFPLIAQLYMHVSELVAFCLLCVPESVCTETKKKFAQYCNAHKTQDEPKSKSQQISFLDSPQRNDLAFKSI